MKISRNDEEEKEELNKNKLIKEKDEEIKVENGQEIEEKNENKEKTKIIEKEEEEIEEEDKKREEDNEEININESKEEKDIEDLNDYEIRKKNDEDSDDNLIRYTASDVELFFNQNDSSDELSKSMRDFLQNNKNRFRHINPLRIKSKTYNKKSENKIKSQREAITELVTNLKTQYILFNIKDFIRQYQIKSNPYINTKIHKSIRILRNVCLYIYGIVMLFERPWFCYKGTTIPLPSQFNFIEDCEKTVEFMNIPFLYNDILRVVEILQTFLIAVTQIMKYRDEYYLKGTNTGVNKCYNIIQIILYFSLFLCLSDLVLSLIMGKFPIVNFVLRPFIYIYLIRRLRMNWTSILKVIWKTKKAYFVLFTNMITFSVIGHLFFYKKGGFFETFIQSVLELYILLSTCNFPDIMLEAMNISKFSFIYFFIYISINYFIILSYLKTLYTTKYYEVNKRDCLDIIKNIIKNKNNKHIFYGKNFNHFILKQKKIYSLNDDEYNNILILFNLYDKNSEIYEELIKLVETTPEMNMISKTKYGKYILKSKNVEIFVNILCIICTASLFSRNIFLVIFRLLVSLCLLYEPIIIIKYIGFTRFFNRHFNRVIFHIFNLIVIIISIYIFTVDQIKEQEKFETVFRMLKIFVSLRTIRVFVFLDKFRIIKSIYIIIRVSKEMLYRNLLLLYSFFLLFSTLSILLTGGNIKKKAFEDEDDSIPNGYVYVNFNDFGSSYIACFCLMMINNLNILVKSLTFQSRHKMFFQFYFATFYFFATLILINIIQTLLLEMYLISDHSLSGKDKNKKIDTIHEVNEDEESDDNYHRINDDKKGD